MLRFTLSALLFFVFSLAFGQEIIQVNANVTVKNVSNRPIGMNMNYLMDDDTYLKPATSTADALKSMGVKILRFPGGEKSDNYIWGQRPFTSANHTLAATGNCYWPNNDPRFAENDYKTLKASTLDFDEFMLIAQQTGAQPLIVVNADGHRQPASTCNGRPVRDSLITVAKEWVRYANIVKKHQIKYWMVGNETFNVTGYTEAQVADMYRQDLILFAQAMKAVDPTIKIIANGKSDNWWKIVLSDPVAASYIDYLGLSVYPMWNWNSYETYRTTSPNFTAPVTTAISAINKYVTNAADRQRIRAITTEVNAIDWGNTPWTNNNDLAHALVSFDMLGKQLLEPKLDYACFWNTRWVNNATAPNHIYDALSSTGRLQASGQALAIWGNYLLDSLISVNSTSRIVSYATRDLDKLNIILINKDTVGHQVNLNLANFTNSGTATRHVFKGTSLTDTNPTFSAATSVTAVTTSKNTQYNFRTDAASITVLSFSTNSLLLPVELLNFEVKKSGSDAKLTWQTASEKDNAGFVVEVSDDGQNFRKLGYVPANKNSGSAITDYSFLDAEKDKSGTRYYRLKQIDVNGQETTYEIKAIKFSGVRPKSSIYPNPGHHLYEIILTSESKADLTFSVADKMGKLVLQNKVTLDKGQNKIQVKLSPQQPAGLYFLNLSADGLEQNLKFIKI